MGTHWHLARNENKKERTWLCSYTLLSTSCGRCHWPRRSTFQCWDLVERDESSWKRTRYVKSKKFFHFGSCRPAPPENLGHWRKKRSFVLENQWVLGRRGKPVGGRAWTWNRPIGLGSNYDPGWLCVHCQHKSTTTVLPGFWHRCSVNGHAINRSNTCGLV